MRRTINLAACLLAFAPASLAWSQQEPATKPVRPQTQIETQPRTEARPQTEARPRAGSQAERPGQAQAVAERGVSQLATILALGNKAEIELGNLAAQKTSHEGVREYAKKMVDEHTAYMQKLEAFNPQMPKGNRNRQRLEAAGEQQRAARDARRTETDRPGAAARPAGQMGLLPVIRDAAETRLSMTQETLSRYEGQDFDMGYLGHQVFAHIEMLAQLQAMQGKGSPEFQQVVEEGIESTKQHLEAAKSMAGQLEDKERGGDRPQPSPATRPAQPN